MAEFTDAGVSLDDLDTIIAEIDSDFLDEFGTGPTGIDTSAASMTGRQTPIFARRVRETQLLLVEILSLVNLRNASGRFLDFIGTLFEEPRNPATRATIQLRCYGVPGFLVGDRRVRYVRNGTIWRAPLGTLITADGTVDVAFSADVAGETLSDGTPIEAFQDGSDQWVIVDSSASFFAVESTLDYSAGSGVEGPASYRARLGLAGRSSGVGTEDGIRRAITRVAGVDAVVDNNRDIFPNANGVPGKSTEVVFDSGTLADVCQAIYDSFSDTNQWYGTSSGTAYREDRTPVAVRATPAERIEVAWDVTVNTVGAEAAMPDDAESVIKTALATYTNTTLKIGFDVQPEEGAAAVRSALPVGSVIDGGLVVTVGLKGGPLAATPIPITSRQRARTDAGQQAAEVVSTNAQPFNIIAAQVLQLAVNGGSMQQVVFGVADFAVISAATALEIATVINARMSGIAAGTENGALVIRSNTVGSGSTLQVGAGSTAGLLTVLGIGLGVYSGSDGDITVLIA